MLRYNLDALWEGPRLVVGSLLPSLHGQVDVPVDWYPGLFDLWERILEMAHRDVPLGGLSVLVPSCSCGEVFNLDRKIGLLLL